MLIRRFLPKRLDLYIFTEVLSPFIGGVLFFTFVFLMFQALRLADFFIVHGIPGIVVSKLAFLLTLSFLPMALPISFLISVLVGFGRLSADSELVAFKANGISLYRMAIPTTLIAVFVTGATFVLNMDWVPWSHRQFKQILVQVGNTKVASSIQPGTFTSGFYDLLVYTDEVDRKTGRLKRVFVYDEREPNKPLTVVSKEGELVPIDNNDDLGTAALMKLFGGNIHSNDRETSLYQRLDFGEYRLFLEVSAGVSDAATKPQMLAAGEIRRKMRDTAEDLSPEGRASYRESSTEYWRRISVAMSPLIFIFLGIGFGTVRTRSVRASASIIAFGVIILYWTLQLLGTQWAQAGKIPAPLALQIPNIICLTLGAVAFKKSSW